MLIKRFLATPISELRDVTCHMGSHSITCQRYFNVSSLHELFDTVNAQNILRFIRDIGLYRFL